MNSYDDQDDGDGLRSPGLLWDLAYAWSTFTGLLRALCGRMGGPAPPTLPRADAGALERPGAP